MGEIKMKLEKYKQVNYNQHDKREGLIYKYRTL